MPTTARWSVHGVQGRIDCINYIKDSKKTKDGTLITGINCSSQFAAYEMKVNNDKFHIIEDNDSRTCYHGYQSFDPKEKGLTPEKVHEMGVELMKRLYPDFQVLVTTHVDRSHLHNHYVINAVNQKGRKLEDRLANPIEGLYGLRDMSDKIALEYGLKIIEDAPKIGRFGKSKYLYSEAIKTWRQQIIEKIEYLKGICFSFDELLERLASDGYQIKAGKNIRIRPYGKERFVSIKTLGEGYSEAELKEFFKQKRKNQTVIDFEKYKLLDEDSEILIKGLSKQINPFILRRKKSDVVKELPEKLINDIYIDLKDEQKKLYVAELERVKEEMEKIIETEGMNKARFLILQLLTKLRQICIDPSIVYDNYKDGSNKLEQLESIVNEYIKNNHKILIFSSFKTALNIVKEKLNKAKIKTYMIDGSVPAKDRIEMVDNFNNNDDVKVFLIMLKSGGTGLNLATADVVIHLDLWWNPQAENQATDRAHRIGQKNTVEVIHLITKGTIEEKILELQNKKRILSDKLIDGEIRDKNILSELTKEDIKNLLSYENKD